MVNGITFFFLWEIINILKSRIKENQHQQEIDPPYMYEQNTGSLHKKQKNLNNYDWETT